MSVDVRMPRMSESMEEGRVLEWLVAIGAEVKRGDPLVEIETDKANMTYEAAAEGLLVELLAQEGELVPVGQVIARIGDAEEIKTGGAASSRQAEVAGSESARPAEAAPVAVAAATAPGPTVLMTDTDAGAATESLRGPPDRRR